MRVTGTRSSVQSSRKVGIRALYITVGAIVIAVPVGRLFNVEAAIPVTVVIASTTLFLAWRKYRDERHRVQETKLTITADELAGAVRRDLDEVIRRQHNDPRPIRLSWQPAAAGLFSESATITDNEPARRRGLWSRRPKPADDDSKPDLATAFAATFASVKTGRLVVLGEAGSGKSTLLTSLQLTLLKKRRDGTPVPFMVSLGSWNPDEENLTTWLRQNLEFQYSFLREQVPATLTRRTVRSRAEVMLANNMILPLLDGFDEIPDHLREQALNSINTFLRTQDMLVLSSRTREYRDAARPHVNRDNRTPVILGGTAGIELQNVPVDVAQDYLISTANAGPSEEPWRQVFEKLKQHPHVTEVLRTPLMIDLARRVYNPRSDERDDISHEPGELLRTDRFPTAEAIKQYLIKSYLDACYRTDPSETPKWTIEKARPYLTSLATYLNHQDGTTGFAWWQLSNRDGLPTRRPRWSLRVALTRMPDVLTFGVVAGLVFGTVFGFLFGPAFGVLMGALSGVLCLVGAGLVTVLEPKTFMPREAIDPHGLLTGDRNAFLTYAFVIGPLSGISLGLGFRIFIQPDVHMIEAPTQGWFAPATAMGLVIALVFKFGKGFRRLLLGLCFAVVIWVIGVAVNQPLLWFFDNLVRAAAGRQHLGTATGMLVGTVLGTAVGLALAWSRSTWGSYVTNLFLLASQKDLPLRLTTFLDDAHERGVLRKVGAYYHFRHLELQQMLTEEAPEARQKSAVRA